MSTMLYNSKAFVVVKPDTAKLNITLVAREKTSREAIESVNAKRELVKAYASDKDSFIEDSYHQHDINVRKYENSILYYHRADNTDEAQDNITMAQYNALPETERVIYEPRNRKEFLYWQAVIRLSLALRYNTSTVEDLVGIFNMCTEKQFDCQYDITVSDSRRRDVGQQLYVNCINQGVKQVQEIANKIECKQSPTVNLLEIRDPDATAMPAVRTSRSTVCKEAVCFDSAEAYEPERIIIPELVAELFNNGVEITKTLDLLFEF